MKSEKYSYSWLQIQLGLEKGVCSSLMGDVGTDQKTTASAMDRAKKSGYAVLYLRALFFAADDERAAGDRTGASKLASAGLESYWSGRFAPRPAYNLYYVLGCNAEAADQPHLQTAAFREAAALIDSDENLLVRAWAHKDIANAAAAE